jgi:pimeloyl-ACP methyl ester carboxylesterase
MKKYLQYLIMVLCFLLVAGEGFGQFVRHTPYPIIFVHGLVGASTTWSQEGSFNDIVDYLEGTGLTNGGIIDITLDHVRDNQSFNSMAEDVHVFTDPPPGDFYIINFNVHGTGVTPVAGAIGHVLLNSPIFADQVQIPVIDLTPFKINDIIRIQNEFMQIIGFNGVNIVVDRGILWTEAVFHLLPNAIYNLSNESNQASIFKQGNGLKKAIEIILAKTDAEKVILVGHSMGGLAARQYIREYYNDNNDVAKIVTIGTPHGGANDSWVSGWTLNFMGIDDNSDAVRDLNFNPGVYLFGGSENQIPDNYHNRDVNANKIFGDYVSGLNYIFPETIARTWIVSSYLGLPNDGVVTLNSQYLTVPEDTIMTNLFHLSESKDFYSLIRGLDEPDNPDLAYEIQPESTTKGFITYQRENVDVDYDLFKFNLSTRSDFTISMLGNEYSGIYLIELLNNDLTTITNTSNINTTLAKTLNAGSYFIRIWGYATEVSYQYPYTLNTTSTPIPHNSLSVSPSEEIEFYDEVVNEYHQSTITLTNNGNSVISVTNLEMTGLNADQFGFGGNSSFDVPALSSVDKLIFFLPTAIGEKTASFVITNTSTDAPVISISLHGIGVESATRTLVVNPDLAYNYGNVTVTYSKSKTFKLQNTGSHPLTVTDLSLSGMNEDNYAMINPPPIPFNIETGEIKQVVVKFTPTSIGVKSVDFVIASNSGNASPEHAVTLYGNGKSSAYTGNDNNIVAYEYWFDNDYASKVYTGIEPQLVSMLSATIPTTGLNNGLHQFHIRHKDEKGQWSAVITEVFHKLPVMPAGSRQMAEYEYWFDNDYASKVNTPTEPAQTFILDEAINAASLSAGLHAYHTRFKDDAGQWSSVVTEVFHKLPVTATGERKIAAYEYWFDNDYASKVTTYVAPQQSYLLNSSVDAISLPVGLHNFHLRFKDDGGQWSSVVSEVFYKLRPTSSEPNLISEYRYWFDLDNENLLTINLETPVNPYHLIKDINTCSLPTGDHTIHFQFKDIRQAWSSVVTDTFNIPAPTVPIITVIGSTIICENEVVTLTSSPASSYLWSNGETTQSISVSVAGDYSVTTSDACGISVTSETINVMVAPLPEAIISGEGQVSICIGSGIELSATAQHYENVTWSSSGDGTFSSTSSLTPVYAPGTADNEGGTITLTVTASAILPCTISATDEMTLIINKLPTAFAGDDATTVENESFQVSATAGNYSSLLWQTSGDGSFDDASLLNPVYYPGTEDVRSSTVVLRLVAWPNDPCPEPAADILTLTIMRRQVILLSNGWNSLSSFVLPADQAFEQVMAPISDNLIIAKNMFQVYWPEYGINTIGNFEPSKGYLVKMNAASSLPITGFGYQDKTVFFNAGWNILPVISDVNVSSEELLSQLGNKLIILTDIAGSGIIWPAEGINSIPFLIPGKAYMVKVNGGCSFSFGE